MNRLTALMLLGSTVLGGCGSTPQYEVNRTKLEDGFEQIDSRNYKKAARTFEQLIISTNADPEPFVRQRYAAAIGLSRAHVRAAFAGPFLDDGSDSRFNHLLAAKYAAAYAADWADAAARSEQGESAEQMLPESLAGRTVDFGLQEQEFVNLVVAQFAGYRREIARLAESDTKYRSFESCEAEMDRVGLENVARPWVMLGLFEYWKARAQTELSATTAYQFGVRVRQMVDESFPSDLDWAEISLQVATWIETHPSFDFVAPDRTTKFHRNLDSGPNNEPLTTFRAVRRL